ncbi:hypothetical protein EP7_003098 [Isosphaeraceae bacterium EP7]
MSLNRRSILSAIGVAIPIGLGARVSSAASAVGPAPALRFRPFEEALSGAVADPGRTTSIDLEGLTYPCLRVEVGFSEQIQSGIQGCHNDRPFAGFPAGHLRIVRTGSEPGPVRNGVRLYVSTVDIALTGGLTPGDASRPLDFASLPPAPTFS